MIYRMFSSLNEDNFLLFLLSGNFTSEQLQKCKAQKSTIFGFGILIENKASNSFLNIVHHPSVAGNNSMLNKPWIKMQEKLLRLGVQPA